MGLLTCLRIGFTGRGDDTPDEALTELLRRMEANGHQIVSVSVIKNVPSMMDAAVPRERYEAYIVTRSSPPASHDRW